MYETHLRYGYTLKVNFIKIFPKKRILKTFIVYNRIHKKDLQEKGKEMHFESADLTKVIFPQEFLLVIEKTKKFERSLILVRRI